MRFPLILLAVVALLPSCASYITPGGPADLGQITADGRRASPAAKYPARIAVIQVQQSGYKSQTTTGVGTGAFSVVTKPDAGGEQDLMRLSGLPKVADAIRPTANQLPVRLDSAADLRTALEGMEVDHLLLYTLDTRFSSSDILRPLSVVSFGFSPTQKFQVTSSASAVLLDARSGHVYGSVEEITVDSGYSSGWGKRGAMDEQRLKTERESLNKLLESFDSLWRRMNR